MNYACEGEWKFYTGLQRNIFFIGRLHPETTSGQKSRFTLDRNLIIDPESKDKFQICRDIYPIYYFGEYDKKDYLIQCSGPQRHQKAINEWEGVSHAEVPNKN